MAMIRCRRCGNWVSDYADRCDQCGSPVVKLHTCPGCGMAVSGSNAKCPKCGYHLGVSYNPNSLSKNPNVIDHGVYNTKNDNKQVVVISICVALAVLLIIGLCLYFIKNNDTSYNYSGGGSVSSSGGGSNESVVYVRHKQLDNEKNYSYGDVNKQFEKELIKEQERIIEREIRRQAVENMRREMQKNYEKMTEEKSSPEMADYPEMEDAAPIDEAVKYSDDECK